MADQVGARLATNTADKALAFYSLHAIIAVGFGVGRRWLVIIRHWGSLVKIQSTGNTSCSSDTQSTS